MTVTERKKKKLSAEKAIRRELQFAVKRALRNVKAYTARPGEEGYDPDADCNYKEAPVRVRASLLLAQGAQAAERTRRESQAPQTTIGVVFMPMPLAPDAWEKKAREVEEPAPKLEIEAVIKDAEVVE